MHRDSREYVHRKCSAVTSVDGPSYAAIADPMANMTSTYCGHCDAVFPISEFAWADTQERITDYYHRYSQKASPAQRFLASRSAMFLLAAVAGILTLLAVFVVFKTILVAILLAAVAVIAAFALHTVVIGPMILQQVLGTKDPTKLV